MAKWRKVGSRWHSIEWLTGHKKSSEEDQKEQNVMTAQRRTPMIDQDHSLRSASVVVLEQPAQTLAADDFTGVLADRISRLNNFIFQSFVIALTMKMSDETSFVVAGQTSWPLSPFSACPSNAKRPSPSRSAPRTEFLPECLEQAARDS